MSIDIVIALSILIFVIGALVGIAFAKLTENKRTQEGIRMLAGVLRTFNFDEVLGDDRRSPHSGMAQRDKRP
ncbi:MAG: hypothetical protein V3U79_05065 [Dehalococcoidia bacterium]